MSLGDLLAIVVRFFWFLSWVFLVLGMIRLGMELKGQGSDDAITVGFLIVMVSLAMIYAMW